MSGSRSPKIRNKLIFSADAISPTAFPVVILSPVSAVRLKRDNKQEQFRWTRGRPA